MAPATTKTRILDSAEHLFAQEGFHGTSMRMITSTAEVNLASINYHFGNKDALLRAVIERRIIPLNLIRQERIKMVVSQAQHGGIQPSGEMLLRAFIEPTLEFRNSSPGARDFIALISRAMNEPDKTVRDCFMEFALPIFQLLASSLYRALPHLPRSVLFTRLQFIIGTMSQVMCMDTIFTQNNPIQPAPLQHHELIEQLLKYAVAGLEAPE